MWLKSLCKIKSPRLICCHGPGDNPGSAGNHSGLWDNLKERRILTSMSTIPPEEALMRARVSYPWGTTPSSFTGKKDSTEIFPSQWLISPTTKGGARFPKSTGKTEHWLLKRAGTFCLYEAEKGLPISISPRLPFHTFSMKCFLSLAQASLHH